MTNETVPSIDNYFYSSDNKDAMKAIDITEDLRQRYAEIFLSDSGDEFAICCLSCTEVFFRYAKFLEHMRKTHNLPPKDHSDECLYDERIEELIIYESDEDEDESSQPEHDNLSENLDNITIMSNMNDNGSLSSEINDIINSVAYVGVSEVEYNEENMTKHIETSNLNELNVTQNAIVNDSQRYSCQCNQSECTDEDDADDDEDDHVSAKLPQQQEESSNDNNNECRRHEGPNMASNFNIFDDIDDCGVLLDRALLIEDTMAVSNKPPELCNTQDPPSSHILLDDLKSSFSVYDRLVEYGNISNVSEDDEDDIRNDNNRRTPKMILDDDDSDLDDKLLAKNRLPLMDNKLMLWKFIEAYRNHECLWRTDHPCFRDRAMRQQAYRNIQETMHKKHNFLMSEQQVARKISMLRCSYQRELDKKIKFEKSHTNNSSTDEYLPKLWYFNKLSFIENHHNNHHSHDTLAKGEKRTSDTLKCDICERTCLSLQSLKVHQKMCHSTFKPFECSVCQKRFRFRANMLSHQSTHTKIENRPYTCDLCGIKMTHRQNFLSHMRRHTKEYPYHCKECGQGVTTANELKSHLLRHTGDKPFICDICGHSFKNNGCLNRHLKRHYKIYEHKCDVCGKEFVLRSRLNEHMKMHNESKDYVCDSCGKSFVTSKTLKQHMHLHNDKKNYLCSLASGNDFNLEHDNLAHLTLHNLRDELDVDK